MTSSRQEVGVGGLWPLVSEQLDRLLQLSGLSEMKPGILFGKIARTYPGSSENVAGILQEYILEHFNVGEKSWQIIGKAYALADAIL